MTGPHTLEQNVTSNRIREWRRRRQMTQGDLAAALDTSINTISQFELGKRELTESWMRRLSAALDVTPAELTLDGLAAPAHPWRGPEGMARRIAAGSGERGAGPGGRAGPGGEGAGQGAESRATRALPLFATRPHGDGVGTLGIIWGQAMEQVARPPGLTGAASAYCIYMQGASMTPRFEHGERIYISPTRPARVGDDVVIMLQDASGAMSEQDPVSAHIGRLVSMNDDQIVIAHFRPATEFIIPMDRIAAVHRIYPTAELLPV